MIRFDPDLATQRRVYRRTPPPGFRDFLSVGLCQTQRQFPLVAAIRLADEFSTFAPVPPFVQVDGRRAVDRYYHHITTVR